VTINKVISIIIHLPYDHEMLLINGLRKTSGKVSCVLSTGVFERWPLWRATACYSSLPFSLSFAINYCELLV